MNKTEKMNHARFKTNLLEYLEGTLPEEEMLQISLHLKDCTSCREFAEYLSGSLSLLEETKIRETDPFFYTRVSGRLAGRENPLHGKFRFGRILQPALVTMLIIAAVFAGIEIGGIGRLKDTEKYAVAYLDPWLDEVKSEPIESVFIEY